LPKYLRLADVAINTLERNLVADVALPNKVLQYVASGLRVVSTELSGLRSIFVNSNAVAWEESPERVVKKALQILNDKPTSQPPRLAFDEILSAFRPSTAVSSFEVTLMKLVGVRDK
jgi:hypothetical protein